MPDWLAWAGVIGTFAFGALNVWQYVRYLLDRRSHDAHHDHLLAVKHSLQALRASCTEAIERGEVIRTDQARQWVRQTAWALVSIEGHYSGPRKLDHQLSYSGGPGKG
jgi:hypothetical protein